MLKTFHGEQKSLLKKRGSSWKTIANNLCSSSNDDIYFKVDARAVRERFDLLVSQYLSKQKTEEKASGISPQVTPVDEALESVLEQIKICEEELNHNEKQNDEEAKREKAEDMRKKSMESFLEAKARKNTENNVTTPPSKKQRSLGTETIQYLREKAEADRELRLQELNLQREELRARQEQQNQMFSNILQQNQQILGLVVQLLQKQ
ncbi:uncharacterized protein LOC136074356 [Hydra vulgaris]|uniref:Uncharacterized protein LOC136074356 n=1 Tax=Hydra vulgaris TaxID=6087 RepID=A0ABM4B1R8_HYDVU